MQLTQLRGRSRATILAVGGLVVGITVATGVAQAAGSDTNTVYGCVSTKDGAVRVVAEGIACGKSESAITWSQTGPAGAPGAAGPAGRDGRDGQPGPAGPAAPEPRSAVVGTATITNGASFTFDITSFSTKMTNSGTTSLGGGGGAGKASFAPVTITKAVDANSPTLFAALTRGTHIPKVVIHLNGNPDQTVTLEEVLVSDLTPENTGTSTDKLHEQVSFGPAKIGVSVGGNDWTWNIAENKAG